MSDFDRLVDIPKVRKLDMLRLTIRACLTEHRIIDCVKSSALQDPLADRCI
jgi:hypothetical protein